MGKATHVSRITDGRARKEARDTLKLGRRRMGRRFRVLGDPARPRGTATALTIPAQPLPSRPLKTQGTNNTAPGAKPGRRRTKHGLSNQRMSSPHHSQKKPKLSASSSPTGEPTRTSTMRRSLAALAACAWPSAMRTAWEAPFQSFRQDLPGPSVRVISSNNPRAHYS